MRRCAWLLPILFAAIAGGCAGGASAPSGAPSARPTPAPPPPRFSTPEEAEAALLSAEDRRSFDQGLLTSLSRDPNGPMRALAALAIGRIGNVRGEDLLRSLLADKASDVRAAAAFACEIMGDPTLTSDLIPLLADKDVGVAQAAARAIGFLGRGDGQDALVAAIRTAGSPQPRAAMILALWKYPNAAIQSTAAAFASDPDLKVRGAAIYTLARKPADASLAVLTTALNDSDADSAAAAARGLGVLGKKDSLGPLSAAITGARLPVTISAMVSMEAILEKNPGASVPDEAKSRVLALAGDSNGSLAMPALVLLRQFAGTDHPVFTRLWSIATTGQGRRRQVALLSVVALLKGRAETALKAAAESSDAPLRAAAAESLAYVAQADARPWRDRLYSDANPLVRLSVLLGLTSADSVKQNRDLVNSAVTDADSGVRAAAIDALGLLEDPSILPLVKEAADKSASDATPDVAISAISVCEKLRTAPAARPIVEALYRQPRTLVSRLARRSLVDVFRVDRSAYPDPEYKTDKSPADYAALLADAKKPWVARVETTQGAFSIRLAGSAAPMTVENFVRLAQKKFFDGVTIHRVVPGFVVQDGDPTGTGNGGPGYEIRDEINSLEYSLGTVGMALSGPDTGGSQWFVTVAPEPHLDGIYTVFGQVTPEDEGVVERLEQWDTITRITVTSGP